MIRSLFKIFGDNKAKFKTIACIFLVNLVNYLL
jgi:hypothetical protein